mgnify:FL=1
MADGTLKVGTITTSSGSGTITIGQSGETINVSGTAGTGFGKILQATTTNKTNSFSTSSTSFVEVTGLNVSITPSSTSNKILIMSSFSLGQFGGSTSAHITLYRNSTNLGNASNGMNEIYNSVSGNFSCGSGVVYLDSPSSTSSVTYTIYARTGSGTAYVGNNSETSTITVMEVAG